MAEKTAATASLQKLELNRKYLLKKYGRDHLTEVTEMNLKKKKINKIDSNTFKGLHNLEKLRLEENEIEEIEKGTFTNLSSLELLYLSKNKIKVIDSNIFKGLTQLESLALDENQIEMITPDLLKGLSNIKDFWVNDNKLKRIDSYMLKGLSLLENLRIESNEIALIDSTAFETLHSMKYLYLFNNKLTAIDANTLRGLQQLEKLYLGANQIAELDKDLFADLSNLNELCLNDMKLTRLDPSTFRVLTNLEVLDLNNNQLVEIDAKLFENLKNLKHLFLNDNKLTRIESNSFRTLNKLLRLNLNANDIEEIDATMFEGLTSLKELDLSCNNIKRVDSNVFQKLTKLDKLYLFDNHITEIDERAFVSLTNLVELKLGENKMNYGHRKWFEHLAAKSVKAIELPSDVKLLSFFDSKFCARLKKNNESNEVRFTSCWDEFLKQFPAVDSNTTLPLSSAADSNMMDFEPEITILDDDVHHQTKQETVRPRDSMQQESANNSQTQTNLLVPNGEVNHYSPIIPSARLNLIESDTRRDNFRPNATIAVNSFQNNQLIGEQIRGRLKVKRLLGEGAFGEVYRVLDENCLEKAMKVVKKDTEWNERNEEALERINEVDLLQRAKHENVVKYFEHFDELIFHMSCFCLVFELCENGDLKAQIVRAKGIGKKISEFKIIRWMVEASTGLKYLHDEKIIHRDIKSSNILLTKNNVVKLADFGIAKYMEPSVIFSLSGSRAYMSPELIRSMQFTKKTDIWSLGCVLYELINLELPFPLGIKPDSLPTLPNQASSSRFTWILKSMLEWDKEKRIDANDLFEVFCFERSAMEDAIL